MTPTSSATGARGGVDLALVGGRVIDPETRLDGVRNVGIAAGRVVAVTDGPLEAAASLDAGGCIVAPGFVDLHSHAQTLAGHRLQAFDGVTTALELEAGAPDVAAAIARGEEQGRPLNFGFSASWAGARMHVLLGVPRPTSALDSLAHLGDPRWQGPATAREEARIVALLEDGLAEGGLGVGVLLGYAQRTTPREYLALARAAARAGAPTYTHARDLVELRPDVVIDGAEEIVRAAGETGAHMHWCHINSTSTRHLARVHGLVERVTAEGARVTTEAYPYAAGMTGVGAEFLAPERLAERGLAPSSLLVPATGERIADADRLRHLREHEPHHQVIVVFGEDDDQLAHGGWLHRAFTFPGTVVASDAIFPIDAAGGSRDVDAWPLPPTFTTHPRVAGTYARSLRYMVDALRMSWSEALARCTLGPARIVEAAAPAMRRKGRVQVGCDADLVVFDPDALRDRATYADPLRTSIGMRHVLVRGEAVVRDGELVVGARPGRAVRGG